MKDIESIGYHKDGQATMFLKDDDQLGRTPGDAATI